MNKAELRRVYLNQLKSLTPAEVETLSQQITDQLFASLDFSRFSTVHAFLPIRGKGSSNWAYAWVPVVGPVIGAVAAALLYLWLGMK